MVYTMAQTHCSMIMSFPSLVFKRVEFIAVMFRLELQIASALQRKVRKEDARYDIAKLIFMGKFHYFLLYYYCFHLTSLAFLLCIHNQLYHGVAQIFFFKVNVNLSCHMDTCIYIYILKEYINWSYFHSSMMLVKQCFGHNLLCMTYSIF